MIGYLAVACLLPYLTLKLFWIAGSSVGIAEPSPVDDGVVLTGNIITAALELTAAAIILAFTHHLRAPAWLVVLPVWVGTGLLVPFVITGPVVAVSVVTAAAPMGDGSLQPWVGPLVYGSFGAQAVGIGTTFVLYARARWPWVFRGHVNDRPDGATQPVLVLDSPAAPAPGKRTWCAS